MPGPAPKDPTIRARRNKATTGAKLAPAEAAERVELPERRDEDGQLIEWHPMALEFWEEVWDSPMAGEYLDADIPGLFILAGLTDAWWKGFDQGRTGKELAAEIRLQRIDYGLTPIARRRLQWEVERTEDARERGRKRNPGPPSGDAKSGEPRNPLALVQ